MNKMNSNSLKVYGSIIFAMFCWSLSYVWFKVVFKYIEPISVVLFRLVISSVLLWGIGKAFNLIQPVKKKDIKFMLLLAFFEPFLYFLGESFGMKYCSPTIGAVIIATIPLITPIFAFYFFKEKLTRSNVVGLLFTFIGVSLVVTGGGSKLAAEPIGMLLMFGAVLAANGYSIALRKVASDYNSYSIITYQNTIGIFLFLPFFLVFELDHFKQAIINTELVITIVELAIFSSTLSFMLFTYAVKKIGISKANVFSNAIPVFTAIFAFFMLGDTLAPLNILGIILVSSSLFISQ